MGFGSDRASPGRSLASTQDAFFPRAFAATMPTIVAGSGVHLVDDRGRQLLDVCSGPFLAALGQGNERVLAAMHDQGHRLTYTYSRTTRHPANAALTQRLVGLAGCGYERVHLTSGGSEAVEMAIKMLRAHAVAHGRSRRHRVLSLLPGYHGATMHTLGLNGDLAAPALWGPMTVAADKVPAPLTFRAASAEAAAAESLTALAECIDRVGAEEILAFVMEPIGGQASGVNVPHPSFARGVRELCDRHGIAVVFDEAVTALRTGRFLAAHHDPSALPDLIVLAKGLGAGYAPLGAVLARAELADELADSTGFVVSHSYDACPMACAAGSAVLDEIVEHGLIDHAERIGTRIRSGLDEIAADSPLVGDVRGRGLLLAIELVTDKATAGRFPAEIDPGAVLVRHGLDHGLLLYSRRQNGGRFGDWLLVAPPLIVDEPTADSLVERLQTTIAAAVEELCTR
ncbi:MAG TPA: aminotransferase class III-fold pyridoxal phosphate-dependent enzyme [Ilumatobacteraceae bacterium]|nr:aminotransferase class III-fold pyridoxal phosphate-dependent enzyme [Ilumatobacteraceae bacterium]